MQACSLRDFVFKKRGQWNEKPTLAKYARIAHVYIFLTEEK